MHTLSKYTLILGPKKHAFIESWLYNILLANIRLYRKITLIVTSFGITTLLINSDKTVYFWFKILIELDKFSICNISLKSKKAYLISLVKFLI